MMMKKTELEQPRLSQQYNTYILATLNGEGHIVALLCTQDHKMTYWILLTQPITEENAFASFFL